MSRNPPKCLKYIQRKKKEKQTRKESKDMRKKKDLHIFFVEENFILRSE